MTLSNGSFDKGFGGGLYHCKGKSQFTTGCGTLTMYEFGDEDGEGFGNGFAFGDGWESFACEGSNTIGYPTDVSVVKVFWP